MGVYDVKGAKFLDKKGLKIKINASGQANINHPSWSSFQFELQGKGGAALEEEVVLTPVCLKES